MQYIIVRKAKLAIFLIIFALIIMFDQYTKNIVLKLFKGADFNVVEVTSFLNLIYVKNYGISFGLFNQVEQNQYLLSALNIGIIFVLFAWLWKSEERFINCALSLVVAGAIGNLIDRFKHGYVIDFIDFHVEKWHYPAFNIADSAIVIGVLLLICIPSKEAK